MKCENPKIHTQNIPIFDIGEQDFREIRIRPYSCQKYVLIPKKSGKYIRHFFVEEGAVFRGGAIAIGADMVLEMTVSIEGNSADGSLDLLSISGNNDSLEIHGIGKVSEGKTQVKLRIDQNMILLGSGARVRGRPVLEVGTDSIEGGHSCRIHRISPDSLFYLTSHGIDCITAQGMLVEAEMRKITHLLEERGEYIQDTVLERVRDMI